MVCARSDDGGRTAPPRSFIAASQALSPSPPALALDEATGRIHVVWQHGDNAPDRRIATGVLHSWAVAY